MNKEQRQLKKLIKAAKDYVEFQSIGRGAKLNCAIDDAEKLIAAQSLKGEGEKELLITFMKWLYSPKSDTANTTFTEDVEKFLKTQHPQTNNN